MKVCYIIIFIFVVVLYARDIETDINELASIKDKVKNASLLDSPTHNSQQAMQYQKLYDKKILKIVTAILSDYSINKSILNKYLANQTIGRDIKFLMLRNIYKHNLSDAQLNDIAKSILFSSIDDKKELNSSIRLLLYYLDDTSLSFKEFVELLPQILPNINQELAVILSDTLYSKSEDAKKYLKKTAIGYDAQGSSIVNLLAKAFLVRHDENDIEFIRFITTTKITRSNITYIPLMLGIAQSPKSIAMLITMLDSDIRFENGDDAMPEYEQLSRESASILSLLLNGFPKYYRFSKFDKSDYRNCVAWLNMHHKTKIINKISRRYIIDRLGASW